MRTKNSTMANRARTFMSRMKSELGAIWYLIPALWVTLTLVVSFWPDVIIQLPY